ncbi:MAG: hypothetical protein V5A25_13180 [Halovenus sp.]
MFGPWSYPATELAFGSVAFALACRTDALRRTAADIAPGTLTC